MRLVTDIHDARSAIRRNAAICAVRLDTGRFCPRLAVGAIVIRAHSEPRCPSHLPTGSARVCRGCHGPNESSDPWHCGGCRDDA